MNCSKARKLISPYIDAELSQDDRREFEDHIGVCDSCRSELEANQGLYRLFANTEKFKTPFGFHSRVMANVNMVKPGWSPRIPIPVRLAEGAMVILLIAVGIVSGSFLAKGLLHERTGNGTMASLHLDVFISSPQGTLEGAYLAMTEANHEK